MEERLLCGGEGTQSGERRRKGTNQVYLVSTHRTASGTSSWILDRGRETVGVSPENKKGRLWKPPPNRLWKPPPRGVRVRVRVRSRYLQDGSGQVHVIKGQLIVVLRRVFVECLRSLKTHRCYHGNQVQTAPRPMASPRFPHLLFALPLPPASLFVSQGV